MKLTEKVIERILKEVAAKKISSRRAFERLKHLPYETFSFARVDHHRTLRKGFPEAVYAPGKTVSQLEQIVGAIRKSGQPLIITRLERKTYEALRGKLKFLRYSDEARIGYASAGNLDGRAALSLRGVPPRLPAGRRSNLRTRSPRREIASAAFGGLAKTAIAVLTGGTSDVPVAEEAALTLELIGIEPVRLYDCGVAGLHRLLDQLPKLKDVRAIICVAGMEGALASVVAGLTDRPVIAVPTSVGYGASFRGIAPLLTMLNSCAQGVAVVNIDNGFGAACFAASILSSRENRRP